MKNMDEVLAKRKVIITCGTGGVGKTTLSAAIGLRAACQGKKTVVVTIDPAKRLANSLGLQSLGDHPAELTQNVRQSIEKVRQAGGKIDFVSCSGTYSALMPDTRKTFEDFVRSIAPSSSIADKVMSNSLFQVFSREFSGTNEYMALERLYTLQKNGEYDCIVLDTPPSRNTLAFLDAPQLLARFFEERLIQLLVTPANKLVGEGIKKALQVLEKLTGAGFMTSLLDFANALFETRVNFTANLRRISETLSSEETGFILVSTPNPDNHADLSQFLKSLESHRFRFDGVVINRSMNSLKFEHKKETDDSDRSRARDIVESFQKRETLALSKLSETLAAVPVSKNSGVLAKLPELSRDVHSLEDLLYVASALGTH